jgi:hypothetical protein
MSTDNTSEVSEKTLFGLTMEEWAIIQEMAEYEPTPEEEAKYDEMVKAANKAEKHAKRLKDCGSFSYWFDPHSGRRSGYVMHCDLFRECQQCLQRRASREYDWMKKAVIKNGNIRRTIVANQKEGTAFVRGVHKTKYARYPLMDGTELIFFDAEIKDEDIGREVDLKEMMWEDWTEIVLTPEGRNKSGTLHVPTSPDDEEPFTIINSKQFVTEAPTELIEKTTDEVVAETDYMRPTTPQEVLLYLNKRLKMTVTKLRAHGYDCRVYQKKLKVIHSRIDWGAEMLDFSVKPNFSDSSNLTVNTKNLTSVQQLKLPEPDNWDADG